MIAASTADPQFLSALSSCVETLRKFAEYELEPSIDRRMQELGERKEFLNEGEHEELVALVSFAQRRNVEKLQAQVALRRLHEACPELVELP